MTNRKSTKKPNLIHIEFNEFAEMIMKAIVAHGERLTEIESYLAGQRKPRKWKSRKKSA
jgi:hypothetical protein